MIMEHYKDLLKDLENKDIENEDNHGGIRMTAVGEILTKQTDCDEYGTANVLCQKDIDDITINEKLEYILAKTKDEYDQLADQILELDGYLHFQVCLDKNSNIGINPNANPHRVIKLKDNVMFSSLELKFYLSLLSDYTCFKEIREDFDEKINTSDEMVYKNNHSQEEIADRFFEITKEEDLKNDKEESTESEKTTTSQD